MRIAFFGGSFDPPHRGHIAIATAALERLHLDRVLFAPVGRQPLKGDAVPSSYADRSRMVELAIGDNPGLVLSLLDRPRPEGRPNYTIDSLRELKGTLGATDELFCLLGADSFLMLRQWHRARELLLTCDFIVASRPGFGLDDLTVAIPAGLSPLQRTQGGPGYQAFRTMNVGAKDGGVEALEDAAARQTTIYLMPDLDVDVSATQIRAALAAGTAGDSLLAPGVVEYVESHRLYRENPRRD